MAAIYSDEALAERWDTTKRAVQDMARAGQIVGFKVNRKWRFNEAVVLEYETTRRAPAPTAAFTSHRRRAAA